MHSIISSFQHSILPMTFENLNLIPSVCHALAAKGYSVPTPIQQKAIPHILEGKDLLGCAQTGTGKTAAFALPIIQLLHSTRHLEKHRSIKALILTPTRELAIQVDESFRNYSKGLGLKHAVIYGGVNQHSQVKSLQQGTDIVIATPGRLLDLKNQGYIKLHAVKYFVLDEADRMLDMGFIHDIKKIISILPAKKQTILFSATLPDEIRKLADGLLHNPVKIQVAPVSAPAERIRHFVYHVEKKNKKEMLQKLLKSENINHALVFTRTKHGADKVVRDLNRKNITAQAIHGNKSQAQRQRALEGFKNRSVRILVATDIASRGIDIDKLSHVINYELPEVAETYIHRTGRTGRKGEEGTAFSFCSPDEKNHLRNINKLLKFSIEPLPAGEFHHDDNSQPSPKDFQKKPERKFQHNGRRGERRFSRN